MVRSGCALVALAVLVGGCHSRFRNAAPDLEAVRAHVVAQSGPSVRLAGASGDAGFVVDAIQDGRSVGVARKLERSVDVDAVNASFLSGLSDGLGAKGPPFGLTADAGAPLLQVEVVDYGLVVPQLGARGQFVYDLRVRIYEPDGRRVYRTSLSCAVPAGDPSAVSVALGAVDNVKQVDAMRRAEIEEAFEQAAWACGSELVTRMRKHASPGVGEELSRAVAKLDPAWE